MDPRDLNQLAKRLADEGGPAEYRTAINRAYYAAYNTAVELLIQSGCVLPATAGCHREVREHLEHSGDPVIIASAKRLRELYNRREAADYRMSDLVAEDRRFSEGAVTIAGKVISALDEIRQGPSLRLQAVERSLQTWNRRPGQTYR